MRLIHTYQVRLSAATQSIPEHIVEAIRTAATEFAKKTYLAQLAKDALELIIKNK